MPSPKLGLPSLDKVLFSKPSLVSLYGPAGSGKTNLSLIVSRNAALDGCRVLFINTEYQPYAARAAELGVPDTVFFTDIHDPYQLLELIVADTKILGYDLVIIDSISEPFRANWKEATMQMFAMCMAGLARITRENGAYVLCTFQVLEEHDLIRPIGFPILRFWSDAIASLRVKEGGLRELLVERPISTRYFFRIKSDDVEWIAGHVETNDSVLPTSNGC